MYQSQKFQMRVLDWMQISQLFKCLETRIWYETLQIQDVQKLNLAPNLANFSTQDTAEDVKGMYLSYTVDSKPRLVLSQSCLMVTSNYFLNMPLRCCIMLFWTFTCYFTCLFPLPSPCEKTKQKPQTAKKLNNNLNTYRLPGRNTSHSHWKFPPAGNIPAPYIFLYSETNSACRLKDTKGR